MHSKKTFHAREEEAGAEGSIERGVWEEAWVNQPFVRGNKWLAEHHTLWRS